VTINTDSILECDSVQSVINTATFQINVLPAALGSKAFVSTISHGDTSRKSPAVAVATGTIHHSSLSECLCAAVLFTWLNGCRWLSATFSVTNEIKCSVELAVTAKLLAGACGDCKDIPTAQ